MRQPAPLINLPRDHAPIRPQTVRAALDTLLYSAAAERHTALEHLWLVDAYLLDPENPINPHERLLALQNILVTLVTAELTRHRAVIQHAIPTTADTASAVLAHIDADARTENIELIAWDWLYYHYVRVDLHLTAQEFCQSAHCDERTRRRYQVHGIRRLTERLIEREREARRLLRKYRLYAELPTPFPVHLFGRAELLTQVRNLNAPLLMQVSGSPGVGKTAFVAEMVRAGIDTGRITELIWLDRPPTCAAVLTAVRRRLSPATLTAGNPFASSQKMLLVLDDLTLLADDQPALNRLLAGLAPFSVCLIHPTPLPVTSLSVHMCLDGLSLIDTHALIRALESRKRWLHDEMALSDAEIMGLWETAQGNPAALLRDFHALLADE